MVSVVGDVEGGDRGVEFGEECCCGGGTGFVEGG